MLDPTIGYGAWPLHGQYGEGDTCPGELATAIHNAVVDVREDMVPHPSNAEMFAGLVGVMVA
jgi:hypothetical protein